MKTEYIVLKETILNNNCPECYATESLFLSFKQKKVSSRFMIKIHSTIIGKMKCQKCKSEIFPGRWTEDIERVYNYHKKTIVPQTASTQFKSTFYLIILFFLLAVITISYSYLR